MGELITNYGERFESLVGDILLSIWFSLILYLVHEALDYVCRFGRSCWDTMDMIQHMLRGSILGALRSQSMRT